VGADFIGDKYGESETVISILCIAEAFAKELQRGVFACKVSFERSMQVANHVILFFSRPGIMNHCSLNRELVTPQEQKVIIRNRKFTRIG